MLKKDSILISKIKSFEMGVNLTFVGSSKAFFYTHIHVEMEIHLRGSQLQKESTSKPFDFAIYRKDPIHNKKPKFPIG